MTNADDTSSPPLPWWRFKMLWLVVGGPAVVVVAGLITAVIAVRGADTVVLTPPVSPAADSTELSATPAMHARNHAAAAATR